MFMRRLFSVFLVSPLSFAVLAAPPPDGVLFEDNFDSYQARSFPSGWTLTHAGAGASRQYVDTSRFASSPKSLHLVGSSCWSANAYRPVTLPLLSSAQKVILKGKIFINAIATGGCSPWHAALGLRNPSVGSWGTDYAGVGFNKGGFIYAVRKDHDYVQLTAYQIGRWYTIESKIDFSARTFDVYINGALAGSNLRIYALDTSSPTGIGVSAHHG
jgi:hypothetical protein